jgi:hypothetical protein
MQESGQTGASPSQSGTDDAFKKYSEVVTDEAVTDEGLFKTHRVDDDLFFEIPDSLFNREMLLVTRIAQVPAEMGPFSNAGIKRGEQVVRWHRVGDDILLRRKSYNSVADDSLAVSISVRANNFEPIIESFPIQALSPDSGGVVIDVSNFFKGDVPAISGLTSGERSSYGVRRLDGDRSFIDQVKSFPENVDVRHTLTYEASNPPSDADTGTISMQMYQSMILLPKKPMMPRIADERVGYFTVSRIDFGSDEQKAAEVEYIRRWNLVPSDTAAYMRGELVEPVEPIVYYLDPATPEKWRPYFKQGIEDWQKVFEAAGFKNAIVAREAPTPEENPDWDPEDVRFSTLRYVANMTRNAMGPSVSDPRSGEIIESDILWYHNHIRSYRNRLMIETGAANPHARSLTIDEELIGETMRQVIAHEVGHALGLPHNMIASSSFPVDSLRSPTFTSKYGVAPTIMDYARQNYIAQPGDGVERFVRKVGPYDDYAIEWGYRWFPDVTAPEDEKDELDAMILAHAGDPMYRFASSTGYNPEAQTEDLGDDPVRASGYAVANLRRVVPNLIDWTSTDGKGYEDLDEIYGELLGQWRRYMGHVVTVVGGVTVDPKASNQPGPVYAVVPGDEQRAAVDFLAQNVFETPTWLLDPEILRRIEPAGAVDRIRGMQVSFLNSLLQPNRLQRLIEAETLDMSDDNTDGYPLIEFMDDLRAAVWHELDDSRPVVDTYRRDLQRGYVERLEYLMTEDPQVSFAWYYGTDVDVSQSDIRAYVRGQLRSLEEDARAAAERTRDAATRYHLTDIAERIHQLLFPD